MYSIFNTLSQFDSIKTDQPIYIYGAKTIAIRACIYLEKILNGGGVTGFLVSSKYDNPTELCHKPVYRIENLTDENLGTVIVAVGWQFVEEVTKDLSSYHINNLHVISPLLFDSWPMDIIKTPNCKLSPYAAISESAQIFADETSEVIIAPGVIIHDKVRILAARNSKVIIKENTQLEDKTFIYAETGTLTVGSFSFLHEKSSLTVTENSIITLGGKFSLGEKANISAQGTSIVRLGSNTHLAEKAAVRTDKKSTIQANRNLYLGEGSLLTSNKKSQLKLDHHISCGRFSSICSDKYGLLQLEHHSSLGNDSRIIANEHGYLHLGQKSVIGNNTAISSTTYGRVQLGQEIRLSDNGTLGTCNQGEIFIGNNSTINPNFYLGAEHAKIDIGEDNMFSFFIKMNAGSHEIADKETGTIIDNTAPIITGKHVWLGMGITLLPGCNIGEGSIAGAASLVNKAIPANCICAGAPAKVIRENIVWSREKQDSQ